LSTNSARCYGNNIYQFTGACLKHLQGHLDHHVVILVSEAQPVAKRTHHCPQRMQQQLTMMTVFVEIACEGAKHLPNIYGVGGIGARQRGGSAPHVVAYTHSGNASDIRMSYSRCLRALPMPPPHSDFLSRQFAEFTRREDAVPFFGHHACQVHIQLYHGVVALIFFTDLSCRSYLQKKRKMKKSFQSKHFKITPQKKSPRKRKKHHTNVKLP